MSQLKRFPYADAIDADGHIFEPPDLWEKYIEPQYRDRTSHSRKPRKSGSASSPRRAGKRYAPGPIRSVWRVAALRHSEEQLSAAHYSGKSWHPGCYPSPG
jgi:hypothetical protein